MKVPVPLQNTDVTISHHQSALKMKVDPIVKKIILKTKNAPKTMFMKTSHVLLLLVCFASFLLCGKLNAQFNLGLSINKVNSLAKPNSRMFCAPDGNLTYAFGFVSETTDKSLGLSLYKSFTKLFLDVDIIYRSSKTRYMIKDYTEEFFSPISYLDETYQTFHIPVIAGINYKNIKLGAGTFFNYHLKNDNALGKTFPFENRNRKLDTGVELFLGYKLFNRILLQIRYEKAFVRVGNHIYYNQQSTRILSRMDNVSFGVSVFPGGMDK